MTPSGRQRGFEGVRANPPFGLQKIYIHCFNCTFLSALPLESGPLVVSQLLTITAVQASLVAAMRV